MGYRCYQTSTLNSTAISAPSSCILQSACKSSGTVRMLSFVMSLFPSSSFSLPQVRPYAQCPQFSPFQSVLAMASLLELASSSLLSCVVSHTFRIDTPDSQPKRARSVNWGNERSKSRLPLFDRKR